MRAFRPVHVATVVFSFVCANAGEAQVNPLSQVIALLGDLKSKINAEGQKEEQAYNEYVEWCDDVKKETTHDIKEESAAKAESEATIEEASSMIDSTSAKIEKTGAELSETEAELQKAKQLREKERADFTAAEGELTDVLETIEKAMRALRKNAVVGGSSFAQINPATAGNVVNVLGLMADAASLSGAELQKLVSLAQSHTQTRDSEEEGEFAPPAASVYESRSGSVLDLLEDLKEKATTELSELRAAEATAAHNFEATVQALKDESATMAKQLKSEKSRKAEAAEDKATESGELEETIKLLKTNKAALDETLATCERVAINHKESVKARSAELKAVDEASSILMDMAGGAAEKTYSFVQLGVASKLRTRGDLAHLEVLTLVQKLAAAQPSPALAQLAVQIENVLQAGIASGKDPFAKVKTMIRGLIDQLESEATEDASNKAYCDEEMGKTAAKKEELTDDLDKVTSKLEKATSRVANLKDAVRELQGELSAIASSQAEMDKLRQKSHDDYVENKEELEKGIKGVRKALTVLRDYYSSKDKAAAAAMLQDGDGMGSLEEAPPLMPTTHKKASGAGSGIISVLEVCESDFSKNLEQVEAEEADSLEDYQKMTEENKVAEAAKSEAVKAKTKEYKGLELAITEHTTDRDGLDSELSAVLEYETKLKERCIGKPDSYEERKERRDEQIKGLKEAIKSLSVEASFTQRRSSGGFRGAALLPGQF